MIPEKPRRLDQILSRYGYCSRSEGAGWLRAGRVIVRGAPAVAPDARALPVEVLIDGQPIDTWDFADGRLTLRLPATRAARTVQIAGRPTV